MTTVSVQFADAKKEVILSYFSNIQDAKLFPYQEQIDSSDARYAAFYKTLPESISSGMPSPAEK